MSLIEDISLKERNDYITTNVIADGVLARTVLMPKGEIVVGEIHKYESINILVKGELKVWVNGEVKHLKAPYMIKSNANTRKVAYILEDTVWTSIHRVNSENLEEIEEEILVKVDRDTLIEELKQINIKELKCLG